MAMADPYYEARDEVQKSIKRTRDMLEEWKVKFNSENTAKSKAFQEIHSDIQGEIQQLQYDLQDLQECIAKAESNRQYFELDVGEVQARKDWLKESQQAVQKLHETVSSSKVKAKIDSDQRQLLTGNRTAKSEAQQKVAQENDRFLESQKQEQMQIIRQQDELLDEMARSAQRLGENARTINVELQDQQRMLHELDDDIDRETEKLNFVMKRMGKLLRTSDSKQLWLIIVLIIVTVVLVYLCVA